ncbi:DUF2867 domain-containing protein [Agromyces protaetiae]|uniref:DUF2867 domain-containing protein n=1 Tax=Agromyces protaetiae TaxID=2509455 RepID=A0A4P6FBP6_9MICO|nr:DUF2867 domain-containing protein [Agromyces protaetiae]QAY73254.1 DUF2867 domain-containing protein [Agromyces protaetiae]
MTAEPAFRSLALEGIPRPDYVDVRAVAVPERIAVDPEMWARELFTLRSMPGWVRAAMGVRAALVPLIGVDPSQRGVFDVREVRGEEALVAYDDRHLYFRCGIGVGRDPGLVRVTTVVKLHGRRGRLYFAFIRIGHPFVVEAMLAKTARRLARA